MRMYTLLIVFCVHCFAQRVPSNLDFEHGELGNVPPGWFVLKMLRDAG